MPAPPAPDRSAPTPRASARDARQGLPTLADRPGLVRRLIRPALVLITLVLVADALIGDKGLLEHQRQARRREQIRQELEQRQRENQDLRVRARRLREENPATIEDLARRKLGMIKPGELLFVVKDAEGSSTAPLRTPTPAR